MKERIKKMKNSKKKGFTLIELVAVVAILSLLALIVIPNMTSYTERANTKRIQTEMAGVYTVTKSALDEAKLPGSMFDSKDKAIESFSNQLDDFTNLGLEKLGRYKFVIANDKLTLFYEEEGKWYVYDGTFLSQFEEYTELPSYDTITEYYEDTTGSEIIPEPAVFLVQFLNEGNVEKIQYVKYGENATPPTLYREGYDLIWDESYEGITSNTTINAQWKIPFLATDEDFEWIPIDVEGSYEAINEEGNGYYKYTGGAEIVKIPHEIYGHPMTNYYRMFYKTSVTKVISDNPNVTDMSYMFYDNRATTLDLSSFNTSNVTDMYGMFWDSNATTLDLSSFDTSKVTSMSYMFSNSRATTLDLSNFNTSKVTDMSYMFYNSEATTLDLSNFDTSNVTNMQRMFYNSKATTLNLSSFDTSNVTNMNRMFYNSQATTLDLSSFDTSNITDMNRMFYNSQATTLDLSSFDTSKVTNMSFMFRGSQATTLDLSSFDTSKVTNMQAMFSGSHATTGYARTSEDADRLNTSSGKPSGLTFVVKP